MNPPEHRQGWRTRRAQSVSFRSKRLMTVEVSVSGKHGDSDCFMVGASLQGESLVELDAILTQSGTVEQLRSQMIRHGQSLSIEDKCRQ